MFVRTTSCVPAHRFTTPLAALTNTIRMVIQSSTPPALSVQQSWLQTSPDFHQQSLTVRNRTPTQRALVATEAIPPETTVLRIPSTHLITTEAARQAPHVAAVLASVEAAGLHERLPDALSDSAALLLYLLAELANPNSFYLPWLNTLPPSFRTPLALPPNALDPLSGSTLLPLAETLRDELREMYTDWFLPHISSSSAFPRHVCTYDLFLRAHCIVESRAFKVDSTTLLAPLVDMANHRPAAQCNARARGWSVAGGPVRGLELHTEHAVSAGEELCISYGDLPNWQLLLHYGFALRHNPEERVVVSLQVPEDDPPSVYMLKMLFLNMDNRDELDIDHGLSVEHPLPDALLASTRLLLLDESEAAGISVTTVDLRNPVSVRNETAVVSQLKELVESMLSGFDVFEGEEDGEEEDSFASFCAVYVNGQRAILSKAMHALEALPTTTALDTPGDA